METEKSRCVITTLFDELAQKKRESGEGVKKDIFMLYVCSCTHSLVRLYQRRPLGRVAGYQTFDT